MLSSSPPAPRGQHSVDLSSPSASGTTDGTTDGNACAVEIDARQPLLNRRKAKAQTKKPCRRENSFWLILFALLASVARGMTIAPRVEVLTKVSFDMTRELSFNLGSHGLHLSCATTSTAIECRDAQSLIIENLPADAVRVSSLNEGRVLDTPQMFPFPISLQMGVARLQMIVTTTGGTLSALSTGLWNWYGNSRGRTYVMAIATLGLLLTDMAYFTASASSFFLGLRARNLILAASFTEGLLGGWYTLHSVVIPYISEHTPFDQRATMFSRFQGVLYLGFSLGPALAAWVIRNPIILGVDVLSRRVDRVSLVFGIAAACSLLNFLLALFVLPDSPSPRVLQTPVTVDESASANETGFWIGWPAKALMAEASDALNVFRPRRIIAAGKPQTDFSLTVLAIVFSGYLLSTSVTQVTYLYSENAYGRAVEQLSCYVSFLAFTKVFYLFVILPFIIRMNEPPAKTKTSGPGPRSKPAAKPARSRLQREVRFDMLVTRCSLLIDLASHVLVACTPPSLTRHRAYATSPLSGPSSASHVTREQVLFVLGSSLGSFASGAVPAAQSLALCLARVQARSGYGRDSNAEEDLSVGRVLHAMALLTVAAQLVLGPILFGMIYSGSVGAYPKAVFVVAAGLLGISLLLSFLVRLPKGVWGKGKQRAAEVARGRSRVSKDLRGGAASWGWTESVRPQWIRDEIQREHDDP